MEILNYGSYAKAIAMGMARKNMTQIAKVLFEFIRAFGSKWVFTIKFKTWKLLLLSA